MTEKDQSTWKEKNLWICWLGVSFGVGDFVKYQKKKEITKNTMAKPGLNQMVKEAKKIGKVNIKKGKNSGLIWITIQSIFFFSFFSGFSMICQPTLVPISFFVVCYQRSGWNLFSSAACVFLYLSFTDSNSFAFEEKNFKISGLVHVYHKKSVNWVIKYGEHWGENVNNRLK